MKPNLNPTTTTIQLFVIIAALTFQHVRTECDLCQAKNFVACHNETVFSMCINGTATYNYIACPEGSVCTAEDVVCQPQQAGVTQSCTVSRSHVMPPKRVNKCGVCAEPHKVFSCVNETAIAFCFGKDEPYYGSVSICPAGTVCDLNNELEFCSEATKTLPSCVTEDATTPTITTTTTSSTTTTSVTISTSTRPTTTKISTSTTPTITCPTILTTSTTPTAPPTSTTTTSTPTILTTSMPAITTTLTATPTIISTLTTPTTTKTATATATTSTTTPTTISTSTVLTLTTTTTTIQDINAFCQEKGKSRGSYRLEGDPTCTRFIFCTKRGGKIKYCEDGEFFDADLAQCTKVKPADCV